MQPINFKQPLLKTAVILICLTAASGTLFAWATVPLVWPAYLAKQGRQQPVPLASSAAIST